MVVVVLLLTSRAVSGFYIDYLWHANLGRTDVFWGILGAKLTLFAGFAILFLSFGFNLLGDALRDSLDPRLRGQP